MPTCEININLPLPHISIIWPFGDEIPVKLTKFLVCSFEIFCNHGHCLKIVRYCSVLGIHATQGISNNLKIAEQLPFAVVKIQLVKLSSLHCFIESNQIKSIIMTKYIISTRPISYPSFFIKIQSFIYFQNLILIQLKKKNK